MADNSNFIGIYENALPDDLCDRLISSFENHSGVYQGRTGDGVDLSKKNSLDLMLDEHPDLAPLKSEVMQHTFVGIKRYFESYFLALVGAVSVQIQNGAGQAITLTPENFEQYGRERAGDIVGYLYRSGSINIQKYHKEKGGYPHWHSEYYPQKNGNEALHRVALYMFYLNDVADGGETEFYYQNVKIAPTKGTMVIAPAGFTHTHRGNTPLSNDKYIATSWIMYNRSEKLYP